MNDKTVVVTGANAGIGRATAEGIAAKGAKVVLVARNAEAGERAAREIRDKTGNAHVELELADLSVMDQVKDLAQRLGQRLPVIDVLLHNAGVIRSDRRRTGDGFEDTMAINHLAPFLLTHHLLGNVRRAAQGRVVTVSSIIHARATIDLDDLNSDNVEPWSTFGVYATSKLANILFTRELARRLEGTTTTANCLHPGVVRSDLGKGGDARGLLRLGLWLARPFLTSQAKGARTSIFLACDESVADVSGEYFDQCRVQKTSSLAKDVELAARLWGKSEELLAGWL